MKIFGNKYTGNLMVVVIPVIILVFAFYFALRIFTRLPNTAEMKEYFYDHQGSFEDINHSILSAMSNNGEILTGPDQEIGVLFIDTTFSPSVVIRYYTEKRGIGLGAIFAGMAYLEAEPDTLYPDFEAMIDDAGKVEGFIGYSRVSGNWYHFFHELD